MTYFNFNYVSNPPNDGLVNFSTQLNANWTDVANKLDAFNREPTTIVSPPVGTEALSPESGHEFEVGLWDGTKWVYPETSTSGWSGWTTFPLRSPRVSVTGHTVEYSVNSRERRVLLRGRVQFDASASAWTQAFLEITDDTGISLSWAPVSGLSVMQATGGGVATAGTFQSAAVYVQPFPSGTPTRTAVFVRWQGNAGGGNFIDLNGYSWWY